MTEDQAADLIQYLKGLIPSITPEQMFYLKREFLKFDASAVEKAIERHVSANAGINIARFLEQIRDATPGKATWQQQFKIVKQSSTDEQARIDNTLGRLSEDELQRYANSVLADAPPTTHELLKKSDPHRSPFLRAMIYQRLSSPPAAQA